MAENQQAAAGSDNQNQPQFALQRIYVKDLSFESPNSPLVFQEQWKPQVNLDLNTSHNKVSDNQYEVVLSLTVTAKVGEKVAYIVEIQQGGVFLVQGIEGQQLGQMLRKAVLGRSVEPLHAAHHGQASSDVLGYGH